jgi:VIT1/CCC1 family predicted Fe2+/Mn2+ transporter
LKLKKNANNEQEGVIRMAVKSDIERYRANYLAEQEGSELYQKLAKTERDPHLAELYRRMAETEQRHAAVWADYLRKVGETVPPYTPGWRIRMIIWLAQRFGVNSVLPMVSSMERGASHDYDTQPEARAAGMAKDERSHERLFRSVEITGGGIAGPALARFEGRHRGTGGNALRAAVLGASDGLTTNLSLVMGVAGANLPGHTILFTGLAGMLAGALSMSIGEWLSVQSARELYTHQIAVERQELLDMPEEEREELALIYEAKGIDRETANRMADHIISQGEAALDTLAREELGIDPEELGGSAWTASIMSFMLFAIGAVIPVIPFVFGSGIVAVLISLVLGILGLFIIGVGITLTTGAPLLKSAGRQVLLGLAAAAITFGLGSLVGGRLG